MALTDYIITLAGLFFFWRGWSKGFFQTLLGPLSLIIGSLFSYFYYITFSNIIVAIAIGLIAPIIIKTICSMALNTLFPPNEKKHLSTFSCLSGALLNTLWGESIFFIGIIFIIMIPLEFPTLMHAKADIHGSYAYALIKPSLERALNGSSIPQNAQAKLNALSDPKTLKSVEESKEYKDLTSDQRIQEFLNDPVTSEQIKNKDIGHLIQNPKFIALTKDPELLKKFMALYSTMMKVEETKTTTPQTPPHAP